jgi:hypothetical protein
VAFRGHNTEPTPIALRCSTVSPGRRGQTFTPRILGVSKKRPVSHPRLSALVTDTKGAAGIARAYLEHHYTRPPVPAEGSYAGSRTTNSPASAG